jgi:hypothetical protein
VTLAYLQLALSMALVGANVGVAKVLADDLPVPMILGLRCLLAVIVLWPLARAMEGRVALGRGLFWNLVMQAAFGTLLYNLALLAGLRLTTALEAGLILATLPAVVAIGGAAWLRRGCRPGSGPPSRSRRSAWARWWSRVSQARAAAARSATCWCSAASAAKRCTCCWRAASSAACRW